MKVISAIIIFLGLQSCTNAQKSILSHKAELPGILKECSALTFDESGMWTLSDGAGNSFYRIDTSNGKIVQTVTLSNTTLDDAESITTDANYLYIGDFGNNIGKRGDLKIIRIPKSAVKGGNKVSVQGDIITFSYGEQAPKDSGKKGKGKINCEAFTAVGDSFYLFSKDAGSTRIFSFAMKPGEHVAREIASFKTGGLITAVSLNPKENEIALLGYEQGHKNAFVWIINGIKGHDLLSGTQKRIVLSKGDTDWQMEGITYTSDNRIFISCETTKDVKASLYAVDREKLMKD
jgi:hypothetical protein